MDLLFLVIVVILLHCIENLGFYKSLFVEKAKHEVITSFVLLFGLIAVLFTVFWGIFGDSHEYIAVAAIMAWGPGDGMAAIVGKNYGKHKISGKWIEGMKSLEGSIAMAVTSFVCTLPVLLFMSNLSWYISVIFAIVIAPIASLTELFTKKGLDTITVPIAASFILCIALQF